LLFPKRIWFFSRDFVAVEGGFWSGGSEKKEGGKDKQKKKIYPHINETYRKLKLQNLTHKDIPDWFLQLTLRYSFHPVPSPKHKTFADHGKAYISRQRTKSIRKQNELAKPAEKVKLEDEEAADGAPQEGQKKEEEEDEEEEPAKPVKVVKKPGAEGEGEQELEDAKDDSANLELDEDELFVESELELMTRLANGEEQELVNEILVDDPDDIDLILEAKEIEQKQQEARKEIKAYKDSLEEKRKSWAAMKAKRSKGAKGKAPPAPAAPVAEQKPATKFEFTTRNFEFFPDDPAEALHWYCRKEDLVLEQPALVELLRQRQAQFFKDEEKLSAEEREERKMERTNDETEFYIRMWMINGLARERDIKHDMRDNIIEDYTSEQLQHMHSPMEDSRFEKSVVLFPNTEEGRELREKIFSFTEYNIPIDTFEYKSLDAKEKKEKPKFYGNDYEDYEKDYEKDNAEDRDVK